MGPKAGRVSGDELGVGEELAANLVSQEAEDLQAHWQCLTNKEQGVRPGREAGSQERNPVASHIRRQGFQGFRPAHHVLDTQGSPRGPVGGTWHWLTQHH